MRGVYRVGRGGGGKRLLGASHMSQHGAGLLDALGGHGILPVGEEIPASAIPHIPLMNVSKSLL